MNNNATTKNMYKNKVKNHRTTMCVLNQTKNNKKKCVCVCVLASGVYIASTYSNQTDKDKNATENDRMRAHTHGTRIGRERVKYEQK